MNVFFAKFWIRVVRSMKNLPMSVREALAKVIARILWLAIPKRRHVIETNLRLCFPELSESERRSLAHRVYVRLARAAVDHGTLWESDKETIQKFVTFEGLENLLENKGEPIIVVAPHFAGLDAAGIALNTYVRGVSLYQKQSNPAWDEAVLAGRKRFSDPVLIAKSNESDLRPVLRAILWCIATMTEEGYHVIISKPWENFPTADFEADTRRLNAELEEWIRAYPDQYLWVHRRFKTRPEGEQSLY